MTSITWSNDVNPIKTTIFRFPKSMAITPLRSKFRHFSFHKVEAVFRDYKFLHGAEKSRARARDARKMHFCTPRRVFAHTHNKLKFDNAERQSGRSDDNRKQTFSYYLHT